MTRKRQHDWGVIKQEYIAGVENGEGRVEFPSLRELSEKYDCPFDTIRNKSKRENWTAEREQFQNEVYETSLKTTLDERVLSAREHDELINKITSGLLLQYYELVQEDAERDPHERTAIKFSRNILEVQKASRIALGLPTEATRQETSVSVSSNELQTLEDRIRGLSTDELIALVGGDEEGEG